MLWLVVSNMAFIFHFIYGMSSETHWRSPSFFRGIETTNQFWWSNVIPWLPDYRDDRWVNDVARLAHLTISASNDLALFKNPGFLPPPPAGKRNIYWERQGWENMTHFSGKVAGKYLSGKAKAAAPRGPLPLAGHCPDPVSAIGSTPGWRWNQHEMRAEYQAHFRPEWMTPEWAVEYWLTWQWGYCLQQLLGLKPSVCCTSFRVHAERTLQ